MAPHVLDVGCDEYKVLAGERAAGRRLRQAADDHEPAPASGRSGRGCCCRARRGGRWWSSTAARCTTICSPIRRWRSTRSGARVHAATRGAYREVDLYVPEMVDTTPALKAEPWYRAWQRAGGGASDVVIARSAALHDRRFPARTRAVDCRASLMRRTTFLAAGALLRGELRRRRQAADAPTAAPARCGSASSGPARACRSAPRATVWSSPRRRRTA